MIAASGGLVRVRCDECGRDCRRGGATSDSARVMARMDGWKRPMKGRANGVALYRDVCGGCAADWARRKAGEVKLL